MKLTLNNVKKSIVTFYQSFGEIGRKIRTNNSNYLDNTNEKGLSGLLK